MDRHFARLRPLPGEPGSGCCIVGSLIAGGSSIIGGLLGASAAEDAAGAQQAALKKGFKWAKNLYSEQKGRVDPYLGVGEEALQALRTGTGLGDAEAEGYGSLVAPFTEEQFREDPGYQFRLAEGERAINRAAAARGGYMNPATVKELQRYGGGLADQTYNDAFNRYQTEQGNRFNRLATLMGVGQSAVDQAQNYSTMMANAAQGYATQSGDAAASGILNAANARIQGLTGAAAGGLEQYNINRMLNMYGAGGGYGPQTGYGGQGGRGGY